MRLVIALLIIIYLVGVGVVLSPVVEFDLGQRNGLGLLRQHRAGPAGRFGVAGETRARECEAMTQSVGLHGAPATDRSGDTQCAVARSSAAATHLLRTRAGALGGGGDRAVQRGIYAHHELAGIGLFRILATLATEGQVFLDRIRKRRLQLLD